MPGAVEALISHFARRSHRLRIFLVIEVAGWLPPQPVHDFDHA
ncbi:hypothetical protein ACFO1B_55570 [Dactylosporangium siamense]|nr:hypothetical protein [Dactylosporangium siamense]